MLHERNFPQPTVIVSDDNEYIRDKRLLRPYGLFGEIEDHAEKGLAKIYKISNVNSKQELDVI